MVALQGHPGLPSWLVAERCEAMQVDDQILNRTVFLVQPSSYGFTADGTGFLMDVECEGMSFLYVVIGMLCARQFPFVIWRQIPSQSGLE